LGSTIHEGAVMRMKAWRRAARRVVVTGFALILVLVLAAAGLVGWSVARPLPTTTGTLDVPGLQASVEVLRDERGVPQIYADTPHDLFLAQGYVHAQDRFYEMDVRRHITAGRLSELFGASQVPTDTFVRTLGWRRVAEQEAALTSPATRASLQAYADGVNAYLAERSAAAASAELALLGLVVGDYQPEQWTIVDSIAWLKAMAWDLRGNMQAEITRSLMSNGMDPAVVDQLNPGYDFARDPTVLTGPGSGTGLRAAGPGAVPASLGPAPVAAGPRGVPTSAPASVIDTLDTVLGSGGGPWVGSNAWVVAGSRTATGMPILANDPHLSPSQPGIWYQNGLHCRVVGPSCPYAVSGFGFSGMPGVVIGHNADVAWGLTNLGADVTDLVLERIDGNTYEYEGRRYPLDVRTETIEVAGGSPVTVTVRSTRNGPVVSDAVPDIAVVGTDGRVPGIEPRPGGYPVSLRWTALTPRDSIGAVFAMNAATDWRSFRAAVAQFAVPAQNMLYADRRGHIGYQMSGAIPVRAGGADGRWPAAGWSETGSWVGEIPFAEMPSQLDPPDGFLVSANNAVVGPGYPHLITADWGEGNRARRITQLITTREKLDTAAMQEIQSDTRNPISDELVPRLLAVRPGDAALPAQGLLTGWDGMQPVDSAAAAYFNAVWKHLLELTFADDFAATATGYWFDQGPVAHRIVRGMLEHPDDPLWGNRTDPRSLRTRDDVLRAAMDDAAAELRDTLGTDPTAWRWGALHTLTLTNQTLGEGGPGPVRWALNQSPVEVPGGTDSVVAMSWKGENGYAVTFAPSMRMVVDLDDLDASSWVNQTGQSGHVQSNHYADQTPAFATGTTYPWPFSREAVRGSTADRLELRPPAS
jgi:penicillin amidase